MNFTAAHYILKQWKVKCTLWQCNAEQGEVINTAGQCIKVQCEVKVTAGQCVAEK